jgi:porin
MAIIEGPSVVARLVSILLFCLAGTVSGQGKQNTLYKSGYEDVPTFGGPSSVGETLKEDDQEAGYRFDGLQRGLKSYFDWKRGVNERRGLAFSFDYTALYQGANKSAGAEDDAAGGIFRLFGSWTVANNEEKGSTGSIVYKVESRHRAGTELAPQGLGFTIGYAGLTAAPFSDIKWALTNLYWQQKLNDGRFNIVAGIVDTTDYLNIYGLVNPWTAFSNLAFLTDATIPAPNQGLGAAFGWAPSDNIYVVGGLADTNGDPTRPDDMFDTFFDQHEYFSHLEIGWVSSFDRRYFDNVHLTVWHADERETAGVPDGWGWAFSATKFIDDKWMPFLRLGYAEDGGALWERSVSTGLGYYMRGRKDLAGIGFNWSRPSETGVGPGLRDQYTVEAFYRWQLSQNFAITPDVQLLVDPALSPTEDSIWVFGVRGRLTL